MTSRSALAKELDELFSGPLEDFTAGRNAIAKRLRAEGDPEEAAKVAKLKRPSRAAGVVNRLALLRSKALKKYLGLTQGLRKAMSGKVDAEKLRALARREAELLEELITEARELDDQAGGSVLDRVRETLQAAQIDEGLRKTVTAGRLEQEQRAASVGLENLAAPPEAAKKRGAKVARSSPGGGPAKVEEQKRLRTAKDELSEAKAAAREAAREVARAEGVLTKAERALALAESRLSRAGAKVERLG